MASNTNPSSNASDSPDTSTPVQTASSAYRASVEAQAKLLKGKERYQFLLERKTKELGNLKDRMSEVEAVYFTIPATRSQKERRNSLEKELDEIEESASTVQKQIHVLQQRVQSYEQASRPWQTPVRPAVSTASPDRKSVV